MTRLYGLEVHSQLVHIPMLDVTLEGLLSIPDGARSAILFAQSRGTSRDNPIDTYLATEMQHHGFATLLLDLYTPAELEEDAADAHHRFRTAMLGNRLTAAADWLVQSTPTHHLNTGIMAASTGCAAALIAAAQRPASIGAIVCRSGRPDLAGDALQEVSAPTLLVVGANDHVVASFNEYARGRLNGEAQMRAIPSVGHEFVEPGALEQLCALALDWFEAHLTPNRAL